jgi:arylsulfatase A-like enzyme
MKNISRLSAAMLPVAALTGCADKLPEKPNIIFLLFDDMGYGDLGCYGQELIETPNIDALAQQGIIFTDMYSSAPISAPSRCSIITGSMPATARYVQMKKLFREDSTRECRTGTLTESGTMLHLKASTLWLPAQKPSVR